MKNLVFFVQACTSAQLAKFYTINKRTLRKWINSRQKEIGERSGNYYSPERVRIIFERFGSPYIRVPAAVTQVFKFVLE